MIEELVTRIEQRHGELAQEVVDPDVLGDRRRAARPVARVPSDRERGATRGRLAAGASTTRPAPKS